MLKYRFLQLLVLVTFILLFVGGLVTSTDSGLAVPDWPLSYGTLFPPMVGGVRFEHTHRVAASLVGFLTLILTIWIGKTEKRAGIRRLAIASFGAVVLQGILGGLTVLFRLPAPISILHACIGPVFFSLIVSLAQLTSPIGCSDAVGFDSEEAARPFRVLSALTVFSIFLQILLGAVVRHTGQGLALHIAAAFLVLVLTGLVVTRSQHPAADERWILRPALFLGFLVLVQFFLGIGAYAFTQIEGIPPGPGRVLFPTIHQTLGSLILATSVVLVLRSRTGDGSGRDRSVPDLSLPEPSPCILTLLETTKPRLVFLVLWSVAVGFVLASIGPVDFFLLLKTLAGTVLVAAGAMALNEWMERESDARMKRTENRPLPRGKLTPRAVLLFGTLISGAGILILLRTVNLLTASLGALTLASYLFLYTPLKTKTWVCTLAGALPGALPPVMGWAAARGSLHLEAWVLFSILFVWQLPHFLAIAWMYREDYSRAGFQMLSVVDPTGERLKRQVILYSLALLILSLVPPLAGMTGYRYYLGAFLLGIWFLFSSFRMAFALERLSRSFFKNSILYLSLLFFLMIWDKSPA